MENSISCFQDTLNFFNTGEIEINKYIDDLDPTKKEESFVTYNGINTPEMLEAVSLCLFRSGISLFDAKAKKIIKEKGLKALKNEIEEIASSLERTLNNTTYIRKKSTNIKKSEIKDLMSEEDWKEWNMSLENFISEKKLNSIIVKAKQAGIKLVKKSYYEFVKKYSSLYIKSIFIVERGFYSKFSNEIYYELTTQKLMFGSKEDFDDFNKGNSLNCQLLFNQPSTLGTYIRILKENGLLKTGGNYWLYVTEDACHIVSGKKGQYSSEYMRKLQKTHRNIKVKNILLKYIDIYKSKK